MIEEIGRDVLPHGAEAGRPAEDADLVVVRLADHVRACLDEDADRLEIADRGSDVQRMGVVGEIAHIDVGTAIDEEAESRRAGSCRQRGGAPIASPSPFPAHR